MADAANNPSAAALIIGDEILSGRTQDVNLNYLARFLGALGVDLLEARFVPDIEAEIVSALNALRAKHTYVFTTGGIGPTHDDITADAVAKAFGVAIDFHAEALAALAARYKPGEFNDARKRMARVPAGATLIRNSVSVAPGFQIANVFVLAGVPMIMRAMMEEVAPRLARGRPVASATVTVALAEGRLAGPLAELQKAHPGVAIGSYPFYEEGIYGASLVVRGRDKTAVEAAASAIEAMVRGMGAQPRRSG